MANPGTTFNTRLQLQALFAVVADIIGTQNTNIGIPLAQDGVISAGITIGPMAIQRKTVGSTITRETRFQITFTYRTAGGAVTKAEEELADIVDRLIMSLYADPTLSESSRLMQLDFPATDDPSYPQVSGKEYRELVIVVILSQMAIIPL